LHTAQGEERSKPKVHRCHDVFDVIAHKNLSDYNTVASAPLTQENSIRVARMEIHDRTESVTGLTIDAASMAMSVPAPTEKLRSAAASAGESLMPSLHGTKRRNELKREVEWSMTHPMKATTCPSDFSRRTKSNFPCGRTSACAQSRMLEHEEDAGTRRSSTTAHHDVFYAKLAGDDVGSASIVARAHPHLDSRLVQQGH
jgi:hypothetical protein